MSHNFLIQNHLYINSTILRRVGELIYKWLWIKKIWLMALLVLQLPRTLINHTKAHYDPLHS